MKRFIYIFKGQFLCFIELDLEKYDLKEIKLDGLSSLEYLRLALKSVEYILFGNMFALRKLNLCISSPIDSDMSSKLFDNLPNIKSLGLFLKLCNFELMNNLKKDFNLDLLNNKCNDLEDLSICSTSIDDENIAEIFNDYHFSKLSSLTINCFYQFTKIEKKLFVGRFPILQKLIINSNKNLWTIEDEAFSSLKHLNYLEMWSNSIKSLYKMNFSHLTNLETLKLCDNQIERIEDNTFAKLNNLRMLDLKCNKLSSVNPQSFFGLSKLNNLILCNNKLTKFDLAILKNIPQIESIDLRRNPIENKDILNRFKDSKIKFLL